MLNLPVSSDVLSEMRSHICQTVRQGWPCALDCHIWTHSKELEYLWTRAEVQAASGTSTHGLLPFDDGNLSCMAIVSLC